MTYIRDYTREIAKIAGTSGVTEFSYRTPIENMLKSAAAEFGVAADILQEPSRIKDIGAPDFRVSAEGGGIIGYVECKIPGANLQKLTTTAQLEKYRALSGNMLLTDSWHWLLLRDGKRIANVVLSEEPNTQTRTDFSDLLRTFIETEAEKIGDAKRLAVALARRCALLRTGLETHASDDPERSRLHGLLKAFRTALDSELEFARFADTFAQTLVYSLLMAKLKAPDAKLDLYNINRYIPANFAVIREITTFLQDLRDSEYNDIAWVVDDILATINAMDTAAVSESMAYGRNGMGISDDDDPYIYFYEDFLAVYDANLRKLRGAYYTPPPVVKFIVRATDDVLRRDFGLANGLAESSTVTALDFAAGTGTFLLEMMRTVLADVQPARRNMLTHDHILKNFYGFELMMAPYVIAHLKLSQFLTDNDVPLKEDERINVLLTNTLEPLNQHINMPMMPKLADEANRAQGVKDSPVLVITGNPPYSGISPNRGEWISNLIEDYKEVDGQNFSERKHWLHDDYVKFIRFAQWKMEQVERGVVAVITNHGFLDNPTFRGMRQKLLNTFDALYFLDLHGNAKRRETAPDGGKDENVFDIQQGVAVSILIKNPAAQSKGVFHADLYGKRTDKYAFCLENRVGKIDWQRLTTDSSPYLFVPRCNMPAEYKNAFSIKDIFNAHVSGIVTARDTLCVNFTDKELIQSISEFKNLEIPDEVIRKRYSVNDNYQWKVKQQRIKSSAKKIDPSLIRDIAYRPFDIRKIYYDGDIVFRLRSKVMRHMLAGENLGLATTRQVKSGKDWQHCLVADNLTESTFVSNKTGEITHLFPTFRYDTEMGKIIRRENLNPEFRRWINNRYGAAHSPEAILNCIYAILHSPDYRKRYTDFLRTDFPRVSFPEQNGEFQRLAAIGAELTAAHLLRENCTGELAKHVGVGTSHIAEKIAFSDKTEHLYFNKIEGFAPVPPEVFNFQIGGYRPLNQYLKSRKSRALSLEETSTLQKAANAIGFTIEKTKEIDP